jgi:hypothetical protein
MKALFLILFITFSFSGFSQKTVSLWEFSHKDKTIQVGDTAWVKIGYQQSYFQSTDNFSIKYFEVNPDNTLNGNQHIVFQGKISELNSLPFNSDNVTKTVKFKIVDDYSGKSKLSIQYVTDPTPQYFFTSKVLSINESISNEATCIYFDLYGHEVKSPVNGFYIYRTNTGETGKIFIP